MQLVTLCQAECVESPGSATSPSPTAFAAISASTASHGRFLSASSRSRMVSARASGISAASAASAFLQSGLLGREGF